MRYKVGDEVIIKKNLEINKRYKNDCLFCSDMVRYKGQVAKITYVYGDYYRIDLDNGSRLWVDDMFKSMPDKVVFNGKVTILYENGNKHIAKCDGEDTFDKEKGLLLCLAKSIGYGYNDILKMIENAKDYSDIKISVKTQDQQER